MDELDGNRAAGLLREVFGREMTAAVATCGSCRVWELFVPDGVLDTSGTPLVGHDAIRNWGRMRVASTVQTRHICSGMRFTDRGNGQATGSTLLTVFMHDGDGRGPAVPAVVGEDTDEFIRTDVGWRFVSRAFETLFA
jgi:SnoaL-like domain/Family of unknown function (DUF6510)